MMDKTFIEDEIYDNLRARFLHSGKGRPKSLKEGIQINNRLLVQLHFLRKEGFKTWPVIKEWLTEISPDLEHIHTGIAPTHLSNLAESAANKCSLLDPAALSDFLSAPIDLKFITESLSAVGIFCHTFSHPPSEFSSPAIDLTNNVIIDLVRYQRSKRLSKKCVFLWISRLGGHEEKRLEYAIDSTVKKFEAIRRKDNANDAVSEFLNTPFTLPTRKLASSLPQPSPRPSATATPKKKCSACTDLVSEKHSLLACIKALQNDKCVLNEQIVDFDHKNSTHVANIALLEDSLHSIKLNLRKCQLDKANVASSNKISRDKWHTVKNSLMDEIDKLKVSNSRLEEVVELQKANISKLKSKNKLCNSELSCAREELKSQSQKLYDNDSLQIKSGLNNTYSDDVRQVVMSLQSEAGVSAANVQKCIKIISNGIFHHSFEGENLPSTQTALNMNSESSVLSHIQAADSILNSKNVTVHLDGTSRDHNKVVSHQVTLDDSSTLFLGFSPVVSEDACTLLDVTIEIFKTLSECYSDFSQESSEDILKKILCNINSTMTDRASVMKSFGSKFSEFLSTETGRERQVHFLHCNAHFLLGLSASCDKAIGIVESEFIEETGDQIGRDKEGVFKRFKNCSETGVNRVIRTACDVLGPRGDQKNGYRLEWVVHCEDTVIPSFKSNRFNCFFEAAAAIIHHLDKIKSFFSSHILPDNINLKMKSVSSDIHDVNLMSILCAIALFYLKVTGPYWALLLSKSVKYVDFHVHVQRLYYCLKEWSSDPSDLLNSSFSNVFADSCTFRSVTAQSVHDFLDVSNVPLVTRCLKCMASECMKVTERQLADFLSGPFSGPVADSFLSDELNHCPLTNLVGESSFGDLDLDLKRRPNRKMFNRSSAHVFNRNKTSVYLLSKSKHVRANLFAIARRRSRDLVKQASVAEKDIKNKVREKMAHNQELKIQRKVKEIGMNADIVRRVREHNGPCNTAYDVDRLRELLIREGKKSTVILETFKDEIRYLKCMKNAKCLTLKGTIDDLIERLKEYLTENAS